MDAQGSKTLPQSLEAEQSVIGAMIIDKEAIAKVSEKLVKEDFYRDGHKIIYETILDMFKDDMPVDTLTLVERLKSTDMLERAGGVSYISDLSTSNIVSYIILCPSL